MAKSSKQGTESRPAASPQPPAAAPQEAPTGVQPVEPANSQPAGKDQQSHALKLNVEGSAGQGQRHPDTPAGQHATGSFTGENDGTHKTTTPDAKAPRHPGK